MILDTDGTKPIYMQISEWIETEILNGNFVVDQKVSSQYQLAEMFNINPATAAKGLTILADENILYKKRGLGMFAPVVTNIPSPRFIKSEGLECLLLLEQKKSF